MFSKLLFSGLISANETRNGLHNANQGLLYKGQHVRLILCLKLTPHRTVSVDVEPISYHKMEFKGQTLNEGKVFIHLRSLVEVFQYLSLWTVQSIYGKVELRSV